MSDNDVELRKIYEFLLIFLFACTIPYGLLVPLDPNVIPILIVAPLCLFTVVFFFVFYPPREQITLFAISIEFAILNAVMVLSYFPDWRRFDSAIFIAIGSYLMCNLLLICLMSTRGLSLKEMGTMGRFYAAVGALWNDIRFKYLVPDQTELRGIYAAYNIPYPT